MSAALQTVRMTVPEFQEWVESTPDGERWELIDGEPTLMPSPNERHQWIVMNLLRQVDQLARALDCRALPGLSLLNGAIDDFAPIPDVVVRCGQMVDGGYAADPVFLAEVLSPSTMHNDRGRKMPFYQSLATLRTAMVVYQDEVRVEAWQRDGGEWRREVRRSRSESLALPELDGSVTLADIYQGVPLP